MMTNKVKGNIMNNYQEIAELTDQNFHADARILACEMLCFDKLQSEYNEIKLKHELIGYMPQDLIEERNGLDKKMLQKAQSILDENEFAKFYQAF